jgi:transposase
MRPVAARMRPTTCGRDRYLELAPKYWAATRARLLEAELALPLGHITVPPAPAPEQQPSAS